MNFSNKNIEIKNKNNIKDEVKYFDIGLAILRPILSFFVIMTHCYKYNNAPKILKQFYTGADKFLFHGFNFPFNLLFFNFIIY